MFVFRGKFRVQTLAILQFVTFFGWWQHDPLKGESWPPGDEVWSLWITLEFVFFLQRHRLEKMFVQKVFSSEELWNASQHLWKHVFFCFLSEFLVNNGKGVKNQKRDWWEWWIWKRKNLAVRHVIHLFFHNYLSCFRSSIGANVPLDCHIILLVY